MSADEQCFQTTAPEAWFGWALAAGFVAVSAALVALTLWLPPDPSAAAGSGRRRQRVLAAAPSVVLLVLSVVNLARMGRDEAVELVRESLVPLLVVTPFLGIAVWRGRIVRAGRSLSHGQRLVVAGARVVTTVGAAGAAVAAVGIFAAYVASSVQVDCSTIPR